MYQGANKSLNVLQRKTSIILFIPGAQHIFLEGHIRTKKSLLCTMFVHSFNFCKSVILVLVAVVEINDLFSLIQFQ